MNTARLTATVAFYGSHFTVKIGDNTTVCLTKTQVLDCLQGKEIPSRERVSPPPPSRETVAEFLARGGQITRIQRTTSEPKPLGIAPQETKPIVSRVTFGMLFPNLVKKAEA